MGKAQKKPASIKLSNQVRVHTKSCMAETTTLLACLSVSFDDFFWNCLSKVGQPPSQEGWAAHLSVTSVESYSQNNF